MKAWHIILLFAFPVLVWAGDDDENNAEIADEPITWVDTSHAYATDQSQELTQWMDDFFGDPVSDLEQAESYLRAEFIDDWEDEDGHDFKARLRGKVQLPKISKRLDLVFAGEESGQISEEEQRDEDSVSLQYEFLENSKTRFDLTLGLTSSGVRPGVRFRHENTIGELSSYRFLERVQWEDDEGAYSTTQFDLYRTIGSNNSLRWTNRVRYGEETDGAEWRTALSLRQRYLVDAKRPIATSIFFAVNGVTDPESFTKNYKLGFRFRRQFYRDFLFMELQPAYNYRRRNFEDDRAGVWSIVFKLEIALERDLRRVKKEDNNDTGEDTAEQTGF